VSAPKTAPKIAPTTTSTIELSQLDLGSVSGKFPTTRLPELTARDRRTLELRQFFALPHKEDEERTYGTAITFYFARGFGITPSTYNHDAFYRDANVYMRLHAPELGLNEICAIENDQNPAGALRKMLPKLLDEHAPSAASLDLLAKTLAAELADAATIATRAIADRLRKQPRSKEPVGVIEQDLHETCGDLLRAIASVRRLRAKGRAYGTVAPPTLLPALAFAEEYASAVVDERIAELAQVVDTLPHLRDGKGTALRMRLVLARTAEQVLRRRIEQGFPTPAGDAPEYFTYRTGLLKKEMQRALYVDTRASTRDPFYRNSAAMIAAGLAATWATVAQVQMMQGSLTGAQYGAFLAAAVGAYVLKDRIKEWVRNALAKQLLRWDHDRHIVGDALKPAGLGSFGGRAQERMRWIEADEVDRGVARLRAKHRTVRGVAPELEHILAYERKVTFECTDDPMPDGYGIQELFRLSLDEVIKRLDDPVDSVAYYDPKSATFGRADMPKVYHLNVIASCTDAQQRTVHVRWRVVVNQEGIVHIDPVATRFDEAQSMPARPTTNVPLAAE
jgi:hypothetical protein